MKLYILKRREFAEQSIVGIFSSEIKVIEEAYKILDTPIKEYDDHILNIFETELDVVEEFPSLIMESISAIKGLIRCSDNSKIPHPRGDLNNLI